ncbi:hypothetical protein [Streptomyces rapamycinicus]|uniref:Uncharacterized protein n=1 Tax=Streptomyces rapamycinicus TaxID=1226757 RepID=A0ABR6LY53_9ACTN|nr:hypothetical protein [Streptomyces rapamycinicus]MBB4787273.1 hypothetical protein [Streptomyces rapamycinicus]
MPATVEPPDVARLKGSSAIIEALEGLVHSRQAPPDARFAVCASGGSSPRRACTSLAVANPPHPALRTPPTAR